MKIGLELKCPSTKCLSSKPVTTDTSMTGMAARQGLFVGAAGKTPIGTELKLHKTCHCWHWGHLNWSCARAWECLVSSLQPQKPRFHSFLCEEGWTYSFQKSIDATYMAEIAPITHIEQLEVTYNKTTTPSFSCKVLKKSWKMAQLKNACVKKPSNIKDS